jgi:serine/threonine protein kinase
MEAVAEYNRPDKPDELGALKQFKIATDDKHEEERAVGRLQSEVQALENINHPAVLKLLHSNVAERFIVTEYHPSGTLDKQLQRFKGNVLQALETFRTLVDAIADIHAGYHPRSAYDER